MTTRQNKVRLAGLIAALLLAITTYFYALDSQYIPKNGDENVYLHITRLTAASGDYLPLQSQLDNMRNTKPPLLFWQGIASSNGGKNWDLTALRLPSVFYTLLTAALLLLTAWRLTRQVSTGFIAALTFLAFFSTYRFGRPFLTNAAEVFWLSLPVFALLNWRTSFQSRYLLPLFFGLSIGMAFLYKSFALGLPMTLLLAAWYWRERDFYLAVFVRRDALKIVISISMAVAIFALWFALDPNPRAVWQEFVIGENAGKFDPHGGSYVAKLWWGGSSIWSYSAAFLSNAGLLTFVVIGVCVTAWQKRHSLTRDEQLLWLWIAAFFISFALPSQRSGRYLLAAMPALALLAALNWQAISRKFFVATLCLAGLFLLALAMLAARLQSAIGDAHLYAAGFWMLLCSSFIWVLVALFVPRLTRDATPIAGLLVLLSFAALLRPFDTQLAIYNAATQAALQGKTVAVPCDFRASDERYQFLLPHTQLTAYHENLHFDAAQLAQRYAWFAVQIPLQQDVQTSLCADCKIIGQRLDIRGRQSSAELKEMLLHGKFFEYLFVREVLLQSTATLANLPALTLAEQCR
ncbi:MAG: phospholipid carrier-dependent glycosyltransferase [Sideroxydans sp.]|nr:phospholipid carrier-dependent glycosyltransferase [Sideroxydans sp.]